jgi:hypothetical protein
VCLMKKLLITLWFITRWTFKIVFGVVVFLIVFLASGPNKKLVIQDS